MTQAEILHALRTQLTVPIWPTAGLALGYRTKSAAYAAAQRGRIKTIEGMGRRKPVATRWLREVLFVEKYQAPGKGRWRRKIA
jgi:hypothetical protein